MYDIIRTSKEERNQKILELYLTCKTTREIGEELDIDNATVKRSLDSMLQNGSFSKMQHDPPSSLRIFDIWNFNSIRLVVSNMI